MPNRLIRDGILESEAVLSLPIEGRWLYITILLSADDLGFFEATSFKLARKADINRQMGDKLLNILADADLVRLYEHEGRRYGFIPRFRQRLQITKIRHPLPPPSLISDDSDAINKINNLVSNPPDVELMANRVIAVVQPPEVEVEVEVEKKRERKRGTLLKEESLPPEWEEYCRKMRPEFDPNLVFEDFCDYWKSLAGNRALKTNWLLTWKSWVRRQNPIPSLMAKNQTPFRRGI